MMILFAIAMLADISGPVSAIDTSQFVTAGALSAVQATIPTPMLMVPPSEVPGGAAGTAGTYRTGTAVQPRITRTASCALTVSGGIGSCSATWDTSSFPAGTTIRLAGAPAVVDTVQGTATEQPITCKAYSVSITGISFRCYTAQTVALTLANITAGLNLSPFTAPTAGLVVQVTAIPSS